MEESKERTTFEIALDSQTLERIRRLVEIGRLNFRDTEDFIFSAIVSFLSKKENEVSRLKSISVRRVENGD